MTINHAEIRVVVCETLTALGFDIKEPLEAQADMVYLRRMRKGSETMSMKMRLGLAGMMISSALYILMVGVKTIVRP